VALAATNAGQAAASQTYGAADTGVVSVSSEAHVSQGEEPLSVNPLNPNQLTTVANVFQPVVPLTLNPFVGGGGLQDTRVYTTHDGGRHWLTQKLDQGGLGRLAIKSRGEGRAPEFSDLLNIANTDADSAWDRHGNAYFESGDIHGLYHNGNEVETVWHSTDGGLSWGPHRGVSAVTAATEGTELDRPWLTVDNSGGAHDGRLYTSFETTPFAPVPPKVFIKYSDDHGATWSRTVRVDAGTFETQWNPRARPTVGAGGAVYVVYDRAPAIVTPFTSQDAPIQLVLARSADGGATFQRTIADGDVHRVQSPDEALPTYTEMIPAIAADPKRAGRIALAWPESQGPHSSRIMLRYSSDGGAHWSRRVDVADDPASASDQHDHVTLSWLADGRLFVGWRDRRCCGGSFAANYQEWVRVLNPDAIDSTLAPGRTVEFSDGPQAPSSSGRGALQPDEFQGLAATRLGVGLTWSQLGADKLDHLMFRRVPLSAFGRWPATHRPLRSKRCKQPNTSSTTTRCSSRRYPSARVHTGPASSTRSARAG
jgi:hypothetical protein